MSAVAIAVINQAGGMGKTTLTFNLGYHLAKRGHRVLLVDMDGQASLTRQCRVSPSALPQSIFHAIAHQEALPIQKNPLAYLDDPSLTLDLVPSSRQMYTLDLTLGAEQVQGPALRLKQAYAQADVYAQYDYIMMDCPPALGLASAGAILAATHFLIPIETSEKGMEGIEGLLETIQTAVQMGNHGIKPAGVVPFRYDKRKRLATTYLDKINTYFARFMHMHPPIPHRVDFEYAWEGNVPLAYMLPTHECVTLFNQITDYLETL